MTQLTASACTKHLFEQRTALLYVCSCRQGVSMFCILSRAVRPTTLMNAWPHGVALLLCPVCRQLTATRNLISMDLKPQVCSEVFAAERTPQH